MTLHSFVWGLLRHYTYTYLINGMAPVSNWTGLFRSGEKIRLRFINAATMSYFDIRIPGLKMTVVQADGQNIQPVPVDWAFHCHLLYHMDMGMFRVVRVSQNIAKENQ